MCIKKNFMIFGIISVLVGGIISLYNLKDAENMLNFLTRHKIMDMAGLNDCFGGGIVLSISAALFGTFGKYGEHSLYAH